MSDDGETLDIGEVVRRTGVRVTTLHVWEREGLLEPVGRAGLRRQYAGDAITRIAVISAAQTSGFTLAEIRALLEPGAFDSGQEAIARKLDDLRARQREIAAAIEGLEHALACGYDPPLRCPDFLAGVDRFLPANRDTISPGSALGCGRST